MKTVFRLGLHVGKVLVRLDVDQHRLVVSLLLDIALPVLAGGHRVGDDDSHFPGRRLSASGNTPEHSKPDRKR